MSHFLAPVGHSQAPVAVSMEVEPAGQDALRPSILDTSQVADDCEPPVAGSVEPCVLQAPDWVSVDGLSLASGVCYLSSLFFGIAPLT